MNQHKKIKTGLIFSLDYEIHGNGNGEFENWAYFPTRHMLDIFDEYGAKLTIMAEMGHYWAMKAHKDLFEKEIKLFEEQIKDAVERGHDVQLHFHPQWIDAKYIDGTWDLEFSKRKIAWLCNNYDEAMIYLMKGKSDLESILTPIRSSYRCNCFRSGFLQMQPSGPIIKALIDSGFLSDSSVVKGIKVDDNLRSLDYSDAYSYFKPWRTSDQEICKMDENGKLMEFPILGHRTGFFDKINNKQKKLRGITNIRDLISLFMSGYGKGMPTNQRTSAFNWLTSKLQSEWSYVDFCLSDSDFLINQIRKIISKSSKQSELSYLPIVLIGHSKDFFFANNLSRFFQYCQSIDSLEFTTYSDAAIKTQAAFDSN